MGLGFETSKRFTLRMNWVREISEVPFSRSLL